jgi:colanic acid biosynthesis glycosyl transferase WcaI
VPIPHEVNSLRREWGLNGKFVVAYSGNLGWAHEFGTILDAARMLKGIP